MTHKLQGEVVYLDPSGRDDSNRRRAMRAIVASSSGPLLTSAFEISITVLSGSVANEAPTFRNGLYLNARSSRLAGDSAR